MDLNEDVAIGKLILQDLLCNETVYHSFSMHCYLLVSNLTNSVTHTQKMLKGYGYISTAEILYVRCISLRFNSSFRLLRFRSDKVHINFKTCIIHLPCCLQKNYTGMPGISYEHTRSETAVNSTESAPTTS